MSPSVQHAVERVYEAFSDVPKPEEVDGCPCCTEEEELDALLAKSLRSLSPDDLSRYASSALMTVGSPEDYVYFLPRILEIIAVERGWWPSEEVVAHAIYKAGFPTWSAKRREAVSGYFETTIDDLLARPKTGSELTSWLCAFGTLGVDLLPTLARIEANGAHLIEFYEDNSQPLQRDNLSNGFWDYAPAAREQVVDWFKSERVQTLIFSQYGMV